MNNPETNPTVSTAVKARPIRKNGNGTKRQRRGYLGWLALAALIVVLGLALRPKAISVELGEVARGELTVSVLEEGKTRIRNRYVVSPPLAGLLRRTPLRAGDKLEAGKNHRRHA